MRIQYAVWPAPGTVRYDTVGAWYHSLAAAVGGKALLTPVASPPPPPPGLSLSR